MKIIIEVLTYGFSIIAIILGIISIRRCNKAIKEAEDRLKILEKQ